MTKVIGIVFSIGLVLFGIGWMPALMAFGHDGAVVSALTGFVLIIVALIMMVVDTVLDG